MKILPDIIALILLYFFILLTKWRRENPSTLLINTLLYLYLACVLYFTLMPILTSLPFIFTHPYRSMNLVPFIDLSYARGDFLRQIILNIIMTIPFGFLLPLTKSRPRFLKVILATFLLSLSIELIQPLLSISRSSDITDIITNVFGGFLGYLLYCISKPLTSKLLSHLSKSPKLNT